MSQIFHPSTNTISRVTIFGGALLACIVLGLLMGVQRSSWHTGQDVVIEQPIQFSHKHHVGDDGIDCRYCHTTVETAAFAGIPPTKTCMNCHTQLYADSPYLEPVRASFRTGEPIVWNRVHRVPDYVYFNHSIHVNKGVGCETCHGRVDQMPLIRRVATLEMQWCVDCHRNPLPNLRPQSAIFTMGWKPPANQEEEGAKLARQYHIRSSRDLTSCSTCHR
jgi:hypothetical protein